MAPSKSAKPHRRPVSDAWAMAVAQILGDRDPSADHALDAVPTVTAALKALAESGRLVATYPGQALLSVTSVHVARQSEPGFTRFDSPEATRQLRLSDVAFALEGPSATWQISVATLTYIAPRRGQPASRALFHVWLQDVKGAPFIHKQPPNLLGFGGKQALLLADSDVDTDWLIRDGVDVTQADEIAQALRGDRRSFYVSPDEQIRKQEAIAAVEAAYLAHRGPRPRALAQPDIDVIVREGLAHGLMINLELVHAVTDGRGSPNAIYPKLADAMGRLAPRRPAGDDIDPALRSLWDSLRSEATKAADAALEPARAELEATKAELAAATAALAAERDQDARAAAERARHLERLEAELSKARERIDSLNNIELGRAQEVAQLTAERDALRGQLTDKAAALSALQTEQAAEREAHARALNAERELAAAERDAAASAQVLAAAQADERLATFRRESETKIAELEEVARDAVTKLREVLADGQREKAEADRRHAAVEQRLAELRRAADAAAAQHASERASMRAQIDKALSEAANAQRALSTLEGEHRAVVRERDRLDQLLARLAPADITPPGSGAPRDPA